MTFQQSEIEQHLQESKKQHDELLHKLAKIANK